MLSLQQKRRLVNYHIASRFVRLTTEDGYDFAFVPKGVDPDSAYWRYDQRRKRHNIVINETVDDAVMDRPAPPAWVTHRINMFTERVYDHEGAHSLFTDRDNKKLEFNQKKWKVPFHLWNLMEDARVEAEWRRKFGRRFNWPRYVLWADEKPVDPLRPPGMPMNAIGLFLDCTHAENSPKILEHWVKSDKDPKIQYEGKGKPKYGRRHLVRWYYRRAARAPSTLALLPIIQSWLKTFPETGAGAGEPGEGEGEGMCVGIGGDMLAPGDAGKEGAGEMPAEAQDADGSKHKEIAATIAPKKARSGASTGSREAVAEQAKRDEASETRFYEDKSKVFEIPHNIFFAKKPFRSIDYKRGESLIRLFEKFLEGGEGMVTSRNPSGKIDMRKFLRGADDFYVRKGDDPSGVKKISFIMDVSGSMCGAIEDGVYLAYVLNELVKRRRIECDSMIVSGGNYHRVPMPFDNRILECVNTPGGTEGFANTMRENERELVSSNLTIFFTDGEITDEHIVKEEWHRKGVYTVGLFTGNPERGASLHRWFDSVLVRNDIEAVADSLVQIIKRQ